MSESRTCEMSDIDSEYTDEIICPWCGHKHEMSYEFFAESDECAEIECGECEKGFHGTRHVSVTYSTRRLK